MTCQQCYLLRYFSIFASDIIITCKIYLMVSTGICKIENFAIQSQCSELLGLYERKHASNWVLDNTDYDNITVLTYVHSVLAQWVRLHNYFWFYSIVNYTTTCFHLNRIIFRWLLYILGYYWLLKIVWIWKYIINSYNGYNTEYNF
jgi:hypothetical protein